MSDAQDLYGLPLDRFVPERNRLAKELRGQGQREEAQEVADARKPSIAAWAVNQLTRTQGRAVKALFAAGDELQAIQSQLLGGRGSGEALRDAVAHEREAVDELIEAARGLLSSDGHELTTAVLERVAETLHAAALDNEAREEVKDGCLHRELRHVGLGAAAGRGTPARKARPATKRKRQASEAQAHERLERATRDLDAAHTRRDAAVEALQEAEAELATARERAREASAAHRKAAREV